MKTLPLFTSAYSFRSILNLDASSEEGKSDSIFEIAKEENISNVYLLEDNMIGFLDAKKTSDKLNIPFTFGVRLNICEKIIDPQPETTSKFVIFACSDEGYKKLLKIYTLAATDGEFKGKPHIDLKHLEEFWDEENLELCIPFYDSFLYNNMFYFSNCTPYFSFTKPTFFIEDNGLFIDQNIQKKVKEYTKDNNYDLIPTKSIYYKNKKDFTTWQTYKCIQKRTKLRAPELEFCYSDEFCVESWKEQNA